MIGRVVPTQTRRVELARELLLGQTFLRVGIPVGKGTRGMSPRAVRRAARLLIKNRVRRVLAPDGFPHWPVLLGEGLSPVDATGLVQAMAAPLAMAALSRAVVAPERAAVLLSGERVTRAFADAAIELCRQVKHLVINAPQGGGELTAYLRGEYGLPVSPARLRPDLEVYFSSPGINSGLQALFLFGPAFDLGGLTIAPAQGVLPADCEGLPLLEILWETGCLGRESLAVMPSATRPTGRFELEDT